MTWDTDQMRAAVHDRYGPPEVVSIREVPVPEYGPDEILVEVHATTVTRTDCHYRAGSPPPMRLLTGPLRPKPTVWGCEFAGRVAGVDGAVSEFAAGDRVFGYVEGRFGAHAEYVVVRRDGLVTKIPDGRSYLETAPLTEAPHYALAHLELADLAHGTELLVYGASGGIGSAAVQLARTAGAQVTAVCGPDGMEMVSSLHPYRVIDYATTDFTGEDASYDVVFDAWGMLSYRACTKVMKPRSVYMSTGPGPHVQNLYLPLTTRFSGRRVRFRPPRFDRATLDRFARLLDSGELRAPIDRRYPLERIVDAYRYVESGRKLGNVVIDVVPDGDTAEPTGP